MKSTKNRWQHPQIKNCYIFERYGNCYASVFTKRISLGLAFIPENKIQALKKLSKIIADEGRTFADMKLAEAIGMFTQHHVVNLTRDTQKHYKSVFKQYFPNVNLRITDTESIRKTVYSVLAKDKAAQNTIRTKFKKINKLFNYLVADGYLDKNPIPASWKPKELETAKEVYTQEEINSVLTYIQAHEGRYQKQYQHLYFFIKLASITAMRIEELILLDWSDFADREIKIHGKGNKIRNFPIGPFPQLTKLIHDMKAINSTGRVFPWRNQQTPRKLFLKVLDELGIEHNTRSFHEIRKTTINKWRELGISFEVRTALAGHSIAVSAKNYLQTPDADYFAKNLQAIAETN